MNRRPDRHRSRAASTEMAQVHQGHVRVTHVRHAVQFSGELLDLINDRVHIGQVRDGLLDT